MSLLPKRWENPDDIPPEVSEHIRKYLDLMYNGFPECPHCGAKVERKEQVGRCVYAKPCGHRLYQGSLPEAER